MAKKKKSLKIIVVSSKGGVGKSTVAMQVVAPYLYINNSQKPINFYEFDDENIDSLSYGGSNLTTREPIDVEEFILMDKFIDILSSNKHCCIDVGGNKSTTMCLDALNDCGMGNLVDLAIIPLLDGEQDAINAKNVYLKLKECNPDIKILFALNRVNNPKYIQYQFENFFGDVRGIFEDEYALVNHITNDEKENYIAINNDDVIKFSRRFGITVYEIAVQNRDFVSEFKSANEQKMKKLVGFKHFVYQNSKKYYEQTLKICFDKIDTLVKA
jgi:hypothetical protein